MPAIAIGAVVDVQGRGAVFGALGGGEFGLVAAGIAVLALAGLVAKGRGALLVMALAARVLAGEQVSMPPRDAANSAFCFCHADRFLLPTDASFSATPSHGTDTANHAITQPRTSTIVEYPAMLIAMLTDHIFLSI